MLEDGDKGGRRLLPHLIVKHEQIVVKRQSYHAYQQTLIQDLVPNMVYEVAP